MQLTNSKVGVIVQARLGSTRLKNKLEKEFYENRSLGQIVFQNIAKLSIHFKVVVATTTNEADGYIQEIAEEQSLEVFRGSENNVLSRFIGCAEENEFETIVRVCSDNPFLQVEYIYKLIEEHLSGNFDYTSYFFSNGKPVIKSHLGLFTEVISLKALKEVSYQTNDSLYLEHVTNFLYEHPDKFKINRISIPEKLVESESIRLTIDTLEDFELGAKIYSLTYPSLGIDDILFQLSQKKEYKAIMEEQILKNEK